MKTVETFVPAKVNLTLHVTGQRKDGYHTLDSLAVFADVGDTLSVTVPGENNLSVSGPMSDGVPTDDRNLVIQAAKLMQISADFELEKRLPNAAGLGGGSGDAAAALRVLSEHSGSSIPGQGISIGADVPLCVRPGATRVMGIGDVITPIPNLPVLHAVLVNPNKAVVTADVFRQLENKQNAPMPAELPTFSNASDCIAWLGQMRNDLQEPAIQIEPVINHVFETLNVTPGCRFSRMSGSGATCFGLYDDAETAGAAAGRLQQSHPGWWVVATRLNAPLDDQSVG